LEDQLQGPFQQLPSKKENLSLMETLKEFSRDTLALENGQEKFQLKKIYGT